MITGHVNANLEAVISLSVVGANKEVREIEAVIDTGYSEFLSLSLELITSLNLSQIGKTQLTLADGTEIISDLYQATIIWDGQPRTVQVDAFESAILVGMALIRNCDLHVRAAVDGPVTITPF